MTDAYPNELPDYKDRESCTVITAVALAPGVLWLEDVLW